MIFVSRLLDFSWKPNVSPHPLSHLFSYQRNVSFLAQTTKSSSFLIKYVEWIFFFLENNILRIIMLFFFFHSCDEATWYCPAWYHCSITSHMLSRFSHVQLCDPMDYIAHHTPLAMEFPRQGYCSELPCPPPADLPNPGIKTAKYVSCTGRWVLYH